MESFWWSALAHEASVDMLRTPLALITLIGFFRNRLEWAVYIVWIYYVLLCPFTKVEESFNMQAIHDILFHRDNIQRYDHLEFPGVVPRTFTGPIIVAGISWPVVVVARLAGLSKIYCLLIVRIVLASLTFFCFHRFVHSVRRSFGPNVAFWLCLLTMFQFHFNFYASRPLPNIFALAFVLLCFSYCLNGECETAIWPAVLSAFVFRSELILLYAPIFLPILITGRLSFKSALVHGICAIIVCLGVSIPIDSYFWRRWLWPEGEVWYYNVILNKSSNWGTSPFLWYFYSVLPRTLLLSLPFAPIGAYLDNRIRTILAPALFFMLIYSWLPHKELRFIIYVFPLFNLASAIVCNRIFQNRGKSWIWNMTVMGVLGHVAVNGYCSSLFARAAYGNYPGANTLTSLHAMENGTNPIRIHIDVYCAQTGISRFLHEHAKWEYNKSELLTDGSSEMGSFDYILIGSESTGELDKKSKLYVSTHEISKFTLGFYRIAFPKLRRNWPFVENLDVIWTRRVVLLKKIRMNKDGHFNVR